MIKIKELNISNWGPITERRLEFKPLTIIFGENEKGKTSIVEAMAECLGNLFSTNLSDKIGARKDNEFQGIAKLSVLCNDKPFLLNNVKKSRKTKCIDIEPWIYRLFISRAGDLNIHTDSNITSYLQKLAMPERFLEWEVLKGTGSVRLSESNEITGNKTGQYKLLIQLREKLSSIEKALEIFDTVCLSKAFALEREKELLSNRLNQIKQDKLIYAKHLKKQIMELQTQLEDIKEETIDALKAIFLQMQTIERQVSEKERDLDTIAFSEKRLQQLEAILNEWEGLNAKPHTLSLTLSVILGISAIAAIYFLKGLSGVFSGIILSAGALLLAFLSGRRLFSKRKEQKLIDTIKQLTNMQLNSPKQLSAIIEREKENKIKQESISQSLNNLLSELDKLKADTLKFGIEPDRIGEKINALSRERTTVLEKLNKLKVEFARLNVSQEDLDSVSDDLFAEFSFEEESDIEKRISDLEERLQASKEELRNKLNEACRLTGVEYSNRIKNIFLSIQELKEETEKEMQALLKDLISKIMWNKVKNARIKKASEIAQQILNSDVFQRNLSAFTGNKYEGWKFSISNGLKLYLDAEERDFHLLSSGAQQQILLALRVSILEHQLGKSFIVLDDILQFTDYQRRPYAIETLLNAVKNGWQVIYLSMDNHILSLFKEYVKKEKVETNIIEL